VTVSVTSTGVNAVLRVEDTGAGIPTESLAHIFNVFAQGEQSLDGGRTGLGLGLSLAKSLVEMHRGTIEVASDGVGAGAVFTITLPCAHEERRSDSRSRRKLPVNLTKKRVLLVEDQPDTRSALRHLLELEGHEVTEAADGHSAIHFARSANPEVALVDLGLPDVDGFEVARAIRSDASLRGIRLIALTGYGRPEDREKALEIGFDAFCIKPIERDVLKEILAS
jgi:CheY-like chemotaxis protein